MSFSTQINQFKSTIAGPDEKQARRLLCVILGLGILARVYISFFTSLPNLHEDTGDYFQQSDALLAGGYINFFPNGYPFIISLIRLFTADHTVTALLWLNVTMSSAMIFFVYSITRKLFSSLLVALLAAAVIAFFPSQINYVRWLSTEVPTGFFLLGAFFFYYNRNFLIAGLFFGIATVVRTEILPIALLVIGLEAIRLRTFRPLLLTGLALPLIATAFYCHSKTGHYSISGHGEVNILLATTASGSYIDWELGHKHPEINTSAKAVSLYIKTFRSEPVAFVKRRFHNFWELWGFFPSSAGGSRGLASRLLIGGGNVFLLVFGIFGWWRNRKQFNCSILILPFLVITFVHIVFFAMQRYTYPVEPFLIIPAAWTLGSFFRKQFVKL